MSKINVVKRPVGRPRVEYGEEHPFVVTLVLDDPEAVAHLKSINEPDLLHMAVVNAVVQDAFVALSARHKPAAKKLIAAATEAREKARGLLEERWEKIVNSQEGDDDEGETVGATSVGAGAGGGVS